MYHKLARGYATQFLNQQRDYSTVEGWMDSPARVRALRVFQESGLAKKPGRTAKRMARALAPTFRRPRVIAWEKDFKVMCAETISAAHENRIYDLSDYEKPLYTERSIFMSHLLISDFEEETAARLYGTASVSHHALTRMFEREIATEKNIAAQVHGILERTTMIGIRLNSMDFDPDKTYGLLIPWKNGALPCVTMGVAPVGNDPDARRRVLSIRTFLDEDMLDQEHHERMGGLDYAIQSPLDDIEPGDPDAISRWIEVNIRPFNLMTQSERAEMRMARDTPAVGAA